MILQMILITIISAFIGYRFTIKLTIKNPKNDLFSISSFNFRDSGSSNLHKRTKE